LTLRARRLFQHERIPKESLARENVFANLQMMTRVVLLLRQCLAVLACLTFASCATEKEPAPATTSKANSRTVQLQGKLMPAVDGTHDSLGFKTESNQIYTLVSNRMSSALFIDTNLQTKTLLLKGRVMPGRNFEVTGNLHSIREGKVHELFYYCDVCAIKGSDPGPCMCCRELVVLHEEPVKSIP
jgi:hypothetical protein